LPRLVEAIVADKTTSKSCAIEQMNWIVTLLPNGPQTAAATTETPLHEAKIICLMLEARNLYLIRHSMKPMGNYEKITINLIQFCYFPSSSSSSLLLFWLPFFALKMKKFRNSSSCSFRSFLVVYFRRSKLIVIDPRKQREGEEETKEEEERQQQQQPKAAESFIKRHSPL